jgi:myo-inositol-1-phosphate synthase
MATKKKSGTKNVAPSSMGRKTAAMMIEPAKGKLGVMVVGLGAVATTMIAGVEAVRRGLAKPIGSLTQMGTIRLGKRTDNHSPLIKDFVPLADLKDIVFTGWDIFEDNVYEAAAHAAVLDSDTLKKLKPYLQKIKPMPAVFDQYYVKRLNGTHVKKGKNKRDLAEQLRADIRAFKKTVNRVVMIWAGSTEIFLKPTAVHQSIEAFEKGLEKNDPGIAPSQIYAYAALKEGVPFANGAPNLTVDVPAMIELSKQNAAPICGKDFKTGQTFMKTVLAPAFKARMIGVKGWFSTNILGNRDGEVLDEPQSFKTKEESKLGSLEYIFQPDLYPDLYSDIYHKIRINYYPPRGDENLRLARLSHAVEGQLPLPRLDSGRSDCARSGALPRFGQAHAGSQIPRHSGVVELLPEVSADCEGPLPGARSLHPVDETEEHIAPHYGRGSNHAPWPRVLRLRPRPDHPGCAAS